MLRPKRDDNLSLYEDQVMSSETHAELLEQSEFSFRSPLALLGE